MRYAVKHSTQGVNNSGPAYTDQFLSAIHHNPYNRHDREITTLFVDDLDDAFLFKTEAAAEFAAVFVGGEVIRLPHK